MRALPAIPSAHRTAALGCPLTANPDCAGQPRVAVLLKSSGLNLNELVVFGVWRGSRRVPPRRPSRARSKTIHHETDLHGAADKMIDFHRACHLDPPDPVQAAAGGASTLGAVRRTAENAWFDARFKIR